MSLPPDSQPDNGYLWATNQAGHAMIGMGLALLCAVVDPAIAVTVVTMGYFILWECLYQIRRLGGGLKDSIADTAHVCVGALMVSFPDFRAHIYAGWVVMVLIGVRAR